GADRRREWVDHVLAGAAPAVASHHLLPVHHRDPELVAGLRHHQRDDARGPTGQRHDDDGLPGLRGILSQLPRRLRRHRRDHHVRDPVDHHRLPGPRHGQGCGMITTAGHRRRQTGVTVLGYAAMACVLVLIGVPLYWMVITSFKDRSDIYVQPANWWPHVFHPANYVDATTNVP